MRRSQRWLKYSREAQSVIICKGGIIKHLSKVRVVPADYWCCCRAVVWRLMQRSVRLSSIGDPIHFFRWGKTIMCKSTIVAFNSFLFCSDKLSISIHVPTCFLCLFQQASLFSSESQGFHSPFRSIAYAVKYWVLVSSHRAAYLIIVSICEPLV